MKGDFELQQYRKESAFKETWRRLKKSRTAMFGLAILFVMGSVSILADVIVPYATAISQDIASRLQGPSPAHWFGTDAYGRDVLARIIHGSRISLSIGFIATFFALIAGTVLGSISGYFGGRLDDIITRIIDVFMTIPTILLALAIVSALGPGITNLVLAISISRVPAFVRLIRSEVLGLMNQEYVEAAKAGGSKDAMIILKHILPNCMGTIIVQTTMSIAQMILQAAGLSFLGMGVSAPQPEWGYMLSEAREYMRSAAYLMVFPGACICLATLSLNLLGDGLRDALDPRLKL
jgi:peptide/nickel transport system permease protein